MKRKPIKYIICCLLLATSANELCADFGDELFRLEASDAWFNDNFGSRISISEGVAIIGSSRSGAAYLIDMETGEELRKLTSSRAGEEEYFGFDVAISGDTAIVGAARRSSDLFNREFGAAYLFDVATGRELMELQPSDDDPFPFFGRHVDISGGTAIVSAEWDGDEKSGAVYVYDVATGQERFKLTASDVASSNRFGTDVALSGNTAIVGAEFNNAAYLFDVTTGEELFKLTSNDRRNELFGHKVDISGNTAIVGDWRSNNSTGAAYIFDVTTGEQLFKLTASNGRRDDWFGGVEIDGNLAIVTAPNATRELNRQGAAYMFDVSTGLELLEITETEPGVENGFGGGYAISDGAAMIGAPVYDGAGAAYIFDVSTPPIAGDFDNDRLLTAMDVDLLSAAIRDDDSNSLFDLNGDGKLNDSDRTVWVEVLAGTFFGDADLNQVVEFGDFLALAAKFGEPGGWADGDFDGSSDIQFADFLLLAENFGNATESVAAVPEPSTLSLFVLATLGLPSLRRRQR